MGEDSRGETCGIRGMYPQVPAEKEVGRKNIYIKKFEMFLCEGLHSFEAFQRDQTPRK